MSRLVIAENNVYKVDSTYADPKGEYALFRVKDDNGKNEITCYLGEKSKSTALVKGDSVKILKIERVALGWAKKKVWDRDTHDYIERWVQQTTVNVEIAKQAADLQDVPDDLSWIDEMENAQLPWEDGELSP